MIWTSVIKELNIGYVTLCCLSVPMSKYMLKVENKDTAVADVVVFTYHFEKVIAH